MHSLVRTTRLLAIAMGIAALSGCASAPPANPPTANNAPPADTATREKKSPPGQSPHKWTKANEAEVAKTLDEKFREAAKSFVKLKRDDQVMYCKKYKDIGTLLPQMHCITEAELRKQLEDSDDLRDRMRSGMGRCAIGAGCGAGPDPVSKVPLPQ